MQAQKRYSAYSCIPHKCLACNGTESAAVSLPAAFRLSARHKQATMRPPAATCWNAARCLRPGRIDAAALLEDTPLQRGQADRVVCKEYFLTNNAQPIRRGSNAINWLTERLLPIAEAEGTSATFKVQGVPNHLSPLLATLCQKIPPAG
eukprot:6208260-Pleurochrysis_carterae.AAC.3